MTDDELLILAEQAAELLRDRYAADLRPSETLLVRFSRHKGLRRIELSLTDSLADRITDFFADVPKLKDQAAIHLGLDFLDGVLTEHLTSDREAMPRLEPAPHEFEGQKVNLSGGLRRPSLETAADALLSTLPEDLDEEP